MSLLTEGVYLHHINHLMTWCITSITSSSHLIHNDSPHSYDLPIVDTHYDKCLRSPSDVESVLLRSTTGGNDINHAFTLWISLIFTHVSVVVLYYALLCYDDRMFCSPMLFLVNVRIAWWIGVISVCQGGVILPMLLSTTYDIVLFWAAEIEVDVLWVVIMSPYAHLI